jgi:putative ABC transport system permease protein
LRCPDPPGACVETGFSEIEEIARVNYQGGILAKNNRNVQDNHAAFADSTFFKVFTVPMIRAIPLLLGT